MKRKLCVAIALCGNSKVVMLDEPSAGMDPSARKALWILLKNQKEGKAIKISNDLPFLLLYCTLIMNIIFFITNLILNIQLIHY